MKIYISLPITGRDIEEVESSCIFAAGVIEKKGHTAVSPLEVSSNPDASYAEHMGKDITVLLECDAVLFLDGWEYSGGCLLEQRAAELYHKTLYFNFNDIKEQSKTDINIIMTAEELEKRIEEKQAQINNIKKDIMNLKKQYCEQYAPFKVGDKIKFKDKTGYIKEVKLSYLPNDFAYLWTPFLKNGTIGCGKWIYTYDAHLIEKL